MAKDSALDIKVVGSEAGVMAAVDTPFYLGAAGLGFAQGADVGYPDY
jgi:hypothetical protein